MKKTGFWIGVICWTGLVALSVYLYNIDDPAHGGNAAVNFSHNMTMLFYVFWAMIACIVGFILSIRFRLKTSKAGNKASPTEIWGILLTALFIIYIVLRVTVILTSFEFPVIDLGKTAVLKFGKTHKMCVGVEDFYMHEPYNKDYVLISPCQLDIVIEKKLKDPGDAYGVLNDSTKGSGILTDIFQEKSQLPNGAEYMKIRIHGHLDKALGKTEYYIDFPFKRYYVNPKLRPAIRDILGKKDSEDSFIMEYKLLDGKPEPVMLFFNGMSIDEIAKQQMSGVPVDKYNIGKNPVELKLKLEPLLLNDRVYLTLDGFREIDPAGKEFKAGEAAYLGFKKDVSGFDVPAGIYKESEKKPETIKFRVVGIFDGKVWLWPFMKYEYAMPSFTGSEVVYKFIQKQGEKPAFITVKTGEEGMEVEKLFIEDVDAENYIFAKKKKLDAFWQKQSGKTGEKEKTEDESAGNAGKNVESIDKELDTTDTKKLIEEGSVYKFRISKRASLKYESRELIVSGGGLVIAGLNNHALTEDQRYYILLKKLKNGFAAADELLKNRPETGDYIDVNTESLYSNIKDYKAPGAIYSPSFTIKSKIINWHNYYEMFDTLGIWNSSVEMGDVPKDAYVTVRCRRGSIYVDSFNVDGKEYKLELDKEKIPNK